MLRSLILVSLLLPLSACGLRGELVRPAPMWGDPPLEGPNDPRVLAEKEARDAADKKRRDEERERQRAERDAEAAASPTPSPSASATPSPAPSPN